MATIRGLYKQKEVYWYQPPMIGGVRPKPFSLGTKDENEAFVKAREAHDSPILPDTFKAEVKKYLAAKLATRRLSPALAEVRNYTLLAFGQKHGIINPARITHKTVQDYYDGLLKRGLSDQTAQTYIFALRAFCRWLKDQHKIQFNPCEKVEIRRLVRVPREAFCTKEQVETLLGGAEGELKFILLCGFDTGMRRGEIDAAQPSWFSTLGVVRIMYSECWETKDGELRHVPLTDRFKEFLQTFGKPSPYMVAPWKPKKGKSRYRYDIRAPFEKYVTDKGMSWVTPHVMRHTFISLRVQAGVSLSKIAIWTGTAVKVLQEHYAHLAPIYDRDIEV